MNQPLHTHKTLAVLVLTLLPFAPVSAQVPSTEVDDVDYVGGGAFIVDDVANNTVEDAYQVPTDVRYKLTDLIISNPNTTASCCAQIVGDDTARVGPIVVPLQGTVVKNFIIGVSFLPGTIIRLRNGDSAGDLDFTLRGYRFTPP